MLDIHEDLYNKLVELAIEQYKDPNRVADVIYTILEMFIYKDKLGKIPKITIKVKGIEKLSPEELKELARDAWIE